MSIFQINVILHKFWKLNFFIEFRRISENPFIGPKIALKPMLAPNRLKMLQKYFNNAKIPG